jgi:hypothetical protein
MRRAVTILASAVGLGLYIPAMLIAHHLRRREINVDVEVIEGYYTPSYQRAHVAHREAHHANFALAQLAHRMARSVEHCLDRDRIDTLLERWRQNERRHFVVWAGFWLPIIERYRQMLRGGGLYVDHCRIDAVISASFRLHGELDACGNEIWLWDGARQRIVHEIPVTDAPPVPFEARTNRLVVHGGGWGIGNYRATIPELADAGYSLDVVVHALAESAGQKNGDRAFILDPDWSPWFGNGEEEPGFPPMCEVTDRVVVARLSNADRHPMHDVIRASKAVVSKPGGCTLIDSLAAATPVVLLEPYGYAEQSNAKLWEHLGFGIRYGAWRETGYDAAVLERLHANIIARARGVDYPRAYSERLVEHCA